MTMHPGPRLGVAALLATIACHAAGASSLEPTPSTAVPATAPCAEARPAWIFCDDFEVDRLSKYFEYQSRDGSFVRVAGVGVDGSYGMRASFRTGQVDAGALHLAFGRMPQSYFRVADAGTENYRELWWRLRLRYQPGWTGGGGWKVSRMLGLASRTSWAESMVGYTGSGPSAPYRMVLDPQSGTDPSGKLLATTYNDFAHLRSLGMAKSQSQVFLDKDAGRWLCVEAHIKLNAPEQADGVFELWIDGRAEASRTGLNWVGGFSDYGLNAVFLENYFNGGAPKAQERYFDDLVVSTEPIGC
ncbi:MAG: hypothetical protein ABI647_26495 [Gemmatimonadota bacterium]